jgi:hypothetical protein
VQSSDSELTSLRSQLAAVTGALGPAQRGLSLEAAVRRLVTEVTQVRVLHALPVWHRASDKVCWCTVGIRPPAYAAGCAIHPVCCQSWQAAKGRVAAEEQLVVLREQGNVLEQALAAQMQQTEREETSATLLAM